jgi:hypothetical protein
MCRERPLELQTYIDGAGEEGETSEEEANSSGASRCHLPFRAQLQLASHEQRQRLSAACTCADITWEIYSPGAGACFTKPPSSSSSQGPFPQIANRGVRSRAHFPK